MNYLLRQNNYTDLFQEFEELQNNLSQIFDNNFVGNFFNQGYIATQAQTPRLDVYENKDSLLVRLEVPGLNKEDISITLEKDTLTIQADKKTETTNEEKKYTHIERSNSSFYRSVYLPQEIESEKSKAVYKDGVLELTLAKKENAKPKQLAINVN